MISKNPRRNTYNQYNNRLNQYRFFAWVRRQRNSNQLTSPITKGNNSQVPDQRNGSRSDVKWTDKIQVGLTIIMIIATYYLFTEAQKQTKNAMDAVNEAKRANEIANDNFKLVKSAWEGSIEDTKNRFKIDSTNIANQNKSFLENVNQFDAANRPFVQITNLHIDTLHVNKPITITYNIINFGKFPAQVLDGEYKYWIGFKNRDEELFDSIIKIIPLKSIKKGDINLIVVANTTIFQKFITNAIVTQWQKNQIENGKAFIYFLGNIKYINYLTKKKYKNDFVYKITVAPLNIIAIKNEDKEF